MSRAWLGAGVVLGCAGEPVDTGPVVIQPALIDPVAWAAVAPEDDPYADHRPATVECAGSAFRMETGQLEMQTERCNWFALDFEVLQDVPKGTAVRATLFHTGLWASEPATAHVALQLDGEAVFEVFPPIPSTETEFFLYEASLPRALRAGSTVHLHLHNHGNNAWVLAEFVRLDAD